MSYFARPIRWLVLMEKRLTFIPFHVIMMLLQTTSTTFPCRCSCSARPPGAAAANTVL